MHRVIVCGGRHFNDQNFVDDRLGWFEKNYGPISFLIHGNACGADTCAHRWAIKNNVAGVACPVTDEKWRKYGKRAGILRNMEMLKKDPDYVLAFPGRHGTNHMIDIAHKSGVKVICF